MILNDEKIEWNLDLPDVRFQGKGEGHTYWTKDGNGPAGWTDKLPLPLHWFVYSTGTKIQNYEFVNKNNMMDK